MGADLAKEFHDEAMEGIFASTPPLEANKLLFSLATTEGVGFEHGRKKWGKEIEFINVKRAYFHSEARRVLYVQWPPEDHEEGLCALLRKWMYGTRDAAQNREVEYNKFMAASGFTRGKGNIEVNPLIH